MTNKRFAKNTAWLFSQQIYSGVLSFAVGAVAANYLGPSNFGLISYSASYVAFFSGIARLGLDSVIVRELVTRKDEAGSILGSAMVLRIFASVLSVFALTALMAIAEPGNKLLMTVTLLQSLALVFDVFEIPVYWFHAGLASKYPAIGVMAASTAVCAWRVALLVTGADVTWFAASALIQSSVTLIVVAWMFRRKSGVHLDWSWDMMKRLFKKSYHFMISGLAILIYLQTDKIMIGKLMGDTYVGYYTAAAAVSKLWLFIPHALITSSQPVILGKRAGDLKGYTLSLQSLLLTVILLGLVIGAFFQVFGGFIVKLLYGQEYAPAVGTLSVLVWASLFSAIGSARGTWIVGEGLNRYIKYISMAGAAVNIILNYFFITLWGIAGAAAATLLTEVSATLLAPLLFKPTRPFLPLLLGSFARIKHSPFPWRQGGHR